MTKHRQPSLDTNFDFLAQAYHSLMAYSSSSLFGGLLAVISVLADWAKNFF
jgi:hypothetical protein